jgi:hypothetical protein
MIKAQHFIIEELVPELCHRRFGEKAWWFIDPNLIKLIDALRDEFGQATINNWKWGGNREWSGLRTPDSPWYSMYSQHSYGRAADILFKEHEAEEVRKAIVANPEKWLAIAPSITLEEDVSWLHADVRNDLPVIRTFKP